MGYRPLAQTFFFDSFRIEPEHIVYEYSTDAGHQFTHTLSHTFPNPDAVRLAPALFALGMAEISGYWKAILAPKIIVKAGALNPEQIAFWENLYRRGLGEFFFKNEIDFRNLINVSSEAGALAHAPSSAALSGALVPFGGGKDSLVTGEMLKKASKKFVWFELESLPISAPLMAATGISASIQLGRDVQKNFGPIIDLVEQGAPNGHVPITSVYIFSAVLAALASGQRDVIPSLERSAEFGNTEYLGMEINHQYSKSLEFESAVHDYVQKFVNPNIRVFSLLRPLYEIQIVKEFVRYPKYFSLFVSCNRRLKTGGWCGECAKCAFMFAALSAFLAPAEVIVIFKKNLFEDKTLVTLYKDMTGLGSMKPFDCVGTFEENMLALYLSAEQYASVGLPLPVVLTELPVERGAQHLQLLSERGPHIIPEDYA
ncbi:MAG: hypothetical protein AAB955_00140 [Patescibacteria group bacterium]